MTIAIRTLISTVAAIALAAFVSFAAADDFAPPPWRGDLTRPPLDPRITVSMWEFGFEQSNPIPADSGIFGDPSPGLSVPEANISDMVFVLFGTDGGWTPLNQNFTGHIQLKIPDIIDHEPTKLIRIQMTYLGQEAPYVTAISGCKANNQCTLGYPVNSPVFLGPNHVYEDWAIEPNPDWETIGILANAAVLEIVVDTISSPEPSSTALLTIGGLAMIGAGRRRSARI